MPALTAQQIITDALADLNIYQTGETIASADAADALRRLNGLIGQWAQSPLTVPAIERFVAPLQSGKGGTTSPYTIGVGGDLATPRPANQASVVGAGLLLNATIPPVEIRRGLLTDDGWKALRLKDLTSTLFTSVYYRPDTADDLGTIFLWPVPTDLTNSLVLYLAGMLSTFADLTTSYSLPPGYASALHTNLALELAIPYGRAISADLRAWALKTLATIKRGNVVLSDLANDFAGLGGQGRGGRYNIQTGE